VPSFKSAVRRSITEAMSRMRSRPPIGGLSVVVFAVLMAGSLTAAFYGRKVANDQEGRLLSQRAGEAAALLTNVMTQSQASARSLAAVAAATSGDPAAFAGTAGQDPTVAKGQVGVALVRPDAGGYRVVTGLGPGPAAGQELTGPAADAVRRAEDGGNFTTSPVFTVGPDGQRRIGSALRSGSGPGSLVVYRESILGSVGVRRQLTSTQPFAEIEAALYDGPRADPAQVVLATRALPIPGRTVERVVDVGADKWLLVVAANRPLIGSLAMIEPWRDLARGLVAALLVTALVEVLRRRRAWALALVDERTATLEEQTRSLGQDRERLAEAQRIAHIGSWEWDVGPDVLTWSEELHRIFGVDPATFRPTYDAYLAMIHSDDREAVRAELTACRESPRAFAFDHRIVRPGGEVRWLSCEGLAELDAAGALVRFRGTAQDLTGRRRAEEELAHQAVHDALTGLPNRLRVTERLEQALVRSSRTGSEVAVLFIDLDRFKLVNDGRGHAAGDGLLVTVAERLRGVVRSTDVVARFGGDEFVIVCEGRTAALESALVAERITEALREPVVIDGQEVFLSASIGIAVSDGGGSSDSLLRDADAAMYRAKAKGRARCEFFDATMRTEAIGHLETQSALHRALERDELRVFYQPVVELATGAVTGVEALVRWQHPQHGLMAPGSFIPLAEENGLIVPIGEWVVGEAAAQLARWKQQPWGRSLIANVNLSARQLRQTDLVPALMGALLRSGLGPESLCLELTETTFMEDAGSHRDTLGDIRDLGVGLAIDDFGTGYSSLTYLKRFPVSVLKIDQAFVRGLGEDAADTAIVRSVIDLAHALGLVVVAEGVETADQVAHLRKLGCDQAQGYFFARPQPAEELERQLSANSGMCGVAA
jgi:diguanylate cyclase (GGDEF)-like protein/PAS domain S-box-containing protein